MDNIYLVNGESISLTTQNVVVDGVRHEAILTNRRLILLRSDAPQITSREIPLSTISSAIAGENPLREPTITIVVTAPDGALETIQLVFIRLVSEQKNPQFNEWVRQLKECTKVTIQEPDHSCPGLSPEKMALEKVPTKDVPVSPLQQDPCDTAQEPSYVFRPPKPVVSPDATAPMFSKMMTLVLFIAVVVIAALIAAQFLMVRVPPGAGMEEQPIVSPPDTFVTATTTLPVKQTTQIMTQESPVSAGTTQLVPPTGVWVRIQYSGNYIGSVGTQGRLREINSTGDHFFQIPAKNEVIIADVQKTDASGNLIAVEIYNEGTLIKRVNATTPNANVLINVAL